MLTLYDNCLLMLTLYDNYLLMLTLYDNCLLMLTLYDNYLLMLTLYDNYLLMLTLYDNCLLMLTCPVQCKERMRPVKKSLKQLDNPDPAVSDKEQMNHTWHCLIRIGNHINNCLADIKDTDAIREWRRWVVRMWCLEPQWWARCCGACCYRLIESYRVL